MIELIGKARARAFALAYFGHCDVHLRHAAAVHEALEGLLEPEAAPVRPDTSLGTLAATRKCGAADSLDTVELELALAQNLATAIALDEGNTAAAEWLVRKLLGPMRECSSWDPETVWSRSVGGIVNERVRLSGGCTCCNWEGAVQQ